MALNSDDEYEADKEMLRDEVKKFKSHKKILKEEVINLRQKLGTEEQRSQVKGQALKNLKDFFRKQTDGLGLN